MLARVARKSHASKVDAVRLLPHTQQEGVVVAGYSQFISPNETNGQRAAVVLRRRRRRQTNLDRDSTASWRRWRWRRRVAVQWAR